MTKILTVDDSITMRRMMVATLQEAGFVAVEAEDGQKALLQAQAIQFDMILSDINMPNMNGIELLKALRRLPNYQYIPILMITTETSTVTKMECKSAGATGWLEKPFFPEQLIKIMQKILGK